MKTFMPKFTDKILKNENIILVEDDKVVTAEPDLAKIFKDHFENIVQKFCIECPCKVDVDRDPVVTNSSVCFSFHKVSKEDLIY